MRQVFGGGKRGWSTGCIALVLTGCIVAPEGSEGLTEQRIQQLEIGAAAQLIEEDYRLGIRREVANDRGAKWAGHQAGVTPGRRWYRGRLPVERSGTVTPPVVRHLDDETTAVNGKPTRRPVERPSYVTYEPDTNSLYEVEMPAESAALIKLLEERGYHRGRAPEEPDEVLEAREELVDKEWSENIDDRGRKSSSNFNKIGRLSNGCTATFIGGPQASGQYFVITAAHCIFNWQTGAYFDPSFVPYRAGGSQPYGDWDGWQWMMPSYFIDNCTGISSFPAACVATDIAVLRVGRPSGESYPGAYGFGYYSMGGTDGLNDGNLYHRGYGACGTGEPDANLCDNYLWGDNWRNNLENNDPNVKGGGQSVNGWNRILEHPSDGNSGHSGGPLYRYDNGQKVFGVHSSSGSGCYGSTSGSCPPGEYPNKARRIEPQFYGWILDFMDNF